MEVEAARRHGALTEIVVVGRVAGSGGVVRDETGIPPRIPLLLHLLQLLSHLLVLQFLGGVRGVTSPACTVISETELWLLFTETGPRVAGRPNRIS